MKPARTRVWHRDAKFRRHWLGILTQRGTSYRLRFYSSQATFAATAPRAHHIVQEKFYDAECLRYAEQCGYVTFQRKP